MSPHFIPAMANGPSRKLWWLGARMNGPFCGMFSVPLTTRLLCMRQKPVNALDIRGCVNADFGRVMDAREVKSDELPSVFSFKDCGSASSLSFSSFPFMKSAMAPTFL